MTGNSRTCFIIPPPPISFLISYEQNYTAKQFLQKLLLRTIQTWYSVCSVHPPCSNDTLPPPCQFFASFFPIMFSELSYSTVPIKEEVLSVSTALVKTHDPLPSTQPSTSRSNAKLEVFFVELILQKAGTIPFFDRKFIEINFRHLAGFKDLFLHWKNIFVKCPGLNRNFVTKKSSKSSHPTWKRVWIGKILPGNFNATIS